jgi:hypothetical protein
MIEMAMKYLISLSRPTTLRIDDRDYATTTIHPVEPPQIVTRDFVTLDGFCAFITDASEFRAEDGCKVIVDSPMQVSCISSLRPPWRRRDILARAVPPARCDHPWSEYLDQERFTVWLQRAFAHTDDRAALLRMVGNLRSERVTTLADDGVTQVAAVKAGVSRSSDVEVKNPVRLMPFRTFSEVEQPKSDFIVRLRNGREGGQPTIALFEGADYGWRLQAMLSIRDYLAARLSGSGLPVLA